MVQKIHQILSNIRKTLTLLPHSNFSPGMQAACTKDPFATSRISKRSSANAIMYGKAHTEIKNSIYLLHFLLNIKVFSPSLFSIYFCKNTTLLFVNNIC